MKPVKKLEEIIDTLHKLEQGVRKNKDVSTKVTESYIAFTNVKSS